MATKKELEARITALETEVALLRASQVQPIVIHPSEPWPWPAYPSYPIITYTSGTIRTGTVTMKETS